MFNEAAVPITDTVTAANKIPNPWVLLSNQPTTDAIVSGGGNTHSGFDERRGETNRE
jgi:hypothetical protein